MQNLEDLDDFDYTKTAKMPEGPFSQIRACIIPLNNTLNVVHLESGVIYAPQNN